MLALIPLSGFIATRLRDLQTKQMKVKDERVKSMNEILSGMKVLKLYAWEPSFENLIKDIRERELVFLRKAAMYNAATEFIWSLAPFLVALFSFMTYVFLGNVLEPEVAFVSMALFNILRMPMTMCELFNLETLFKIFIFLFLISSNDDQFCNDCICFCEKNQFIHEF